jgi:hypothetical protein
MIVLISCEAAVILSMLVVLWDLKRVLRAGEREISRVDELWRSTYHEWMQERNRRLKAHEQVKFWRDKWKSGAFEMDAAAMAKLVDNVNDEYPADAA